MSIPAATILAQLESVAAERARRAATPGLAARVTALKAYQQRRFSQTYADLLRSPRYGAAAQFFLDELYGPSDFTHRDAQFARVVPALVRLFPIEIIDTVAALAGLHALSESLDTGMALALADDRILAADYLQAWQRTGRPADRQAQISMTVDIAGRLETLTGRVLMRNSLKLMRGPARAAGLGELQQFLETGFDTFRAMRGAAEFIGVVRTREAELAAALFAADLGGDDPAGASAALALLP